MLPDFVTFTGADHASFLPDMIALASDYPVEFGISLDPAREGNARFPDRSFLTILQEKGQNFALSAHLCGAFALLANQGKGDEINLPSGLFRRAQINLPRAVTPDLEKLVPWAEKNNLRLIIANPEQDFFPEDPRVDWFFDPSEGQGKTPDQWPRNQSNALVGYAGGIGPDNVVSILKAIPEGGPFWIDMASKIRAQGLFSPALCRAVCAKIYP